MLQLTQLGVLSAQTEGREVYYINMGKPTKKYRKFICNINKFENDSQAIFLQLNKN
jgi:hypothetical protein